MPGARIALATHWDNQKQARRLSSDEITNRLINHYFNPFMIRVLESFFKGKGDYFPVLKQEFLIREFRSNKVIENLKSLSKYSLNERKIILLSAYGDTNFHYLLNHYSKFLQDSESKYKKIKNIENILDQKIELKEISSETLLGIYLLRRSLKLKRKTKFYKELKNEFEMRSFNFSKENKNPL